MQLGDGRPPLLVELCGGFLRSPHAPHLVERVHVERQAVEPSLVVGDRGVGVAVELHERVHEVPDLPVGGVEDVRPVAVDVDSLDAFAPDVAAEMGPPVNHEATLAAPFGETGECGSEEAGTDYQIIILGHSSFLFCRLSVSVNVLPCGGCLAGLIFHVCVVHPKGAAQSFGSCRPKPLGTITCMTVKVRIICQMAAFAEFCLYLRG